MQICRPERPKQILVDLEFVPSFLAVKAERDIGDVKQLLLSKIRKIGIPWWCSG